MFSLLLLCAAIPMLLASGAEIGSKVNDINLVELLLNVSDSMKELQQDNAKSFQHILANSEENTDVLKKILQAMATTTTPKPPTTHGPVYERNCAEIYHKGERESGIYTITIPGAQGTFQVYCDMTTDGGGWTVFQRRGDFGNPRDYFYRDWNEYKKGFGKLTEEFWLGNDRLSALTQLKEYQLRVDIWDLDGNQAFAKYTTFSVENEQQRYQLRVSGYTGNAGDSMRYENNNYFSTKDRHNDIGGCAMAYQGAWWYQKCSSANLNGLNLRGPDNTNKGIWWHSWKNSVYSLAFTEMKIRPANF